MKKINVAVCLLFIYISVSAQKHEPVQPKKDRREFQGYTIRLFPATEGTYGYVILKDKELMVHQSRNPFTSSTGGLKSKENAFNVAQWQIEQLKNRQPIATKITASGKRKLPPVLLEKLKSPTNAMSFYNQRLPRKVADDLHIPVTN
jgi:hypothetical protein